MLRVVPADYKFPSLPFCAVKWVRVRASPVWDRDFVYVEHSSWVQDEDGDWCAVAAVSAGGGACGRRLYVGRVIGVVALPPAGA